MFLSPNRIFNTDLRILAIVKRKGMSEQASPEPAPTQVSSVLELASKQPHMDTVNVVTAIHRYPEKKIDGLD